LTVRGGASSAERIDVSGALPYDLWALTNDSFTIWYDDRSVHSGKTFADWEALPTDGVAAVRVYYGEDAPSGRPFTMNLTGDDHYFATPSGILGCSNDTRADIDNRYPGAAVKRGRWVPPKVMAEIEAESVAAAVTRPL
jgi:hypothetical protein